MSKPWYRLWTALALASAVISQPAQAGGVRLCNESGHRVRSAIVVLESFNYLLGRWASRGWYVVDDGNCISVSESIWGSPRSWGFVSIEDEKSEKEIEQERTELEERWEWASAEEYANLMASFSFYDRLMLYLPGTRQRRQLHKLLADEPPSFPIDPWSFRPMAEKKPGELTAPGADGTRYKTCLPVAGFDYLTDHKPAIHDSCAKDRRLTFFSVEFFVTPSDTILLTVESKSIEMNQATIR